MCTDQLLTNIPVKIGNYIFPLNKFQYASLSKNITQGVYIRLDSLETSILIEGVTIDEVYEKLDYAYTIACNKR